MEAASATDITEPDTGKLENDLIELLTGIFATVKEHRPAQAIKGLICEAQFDQSFAEAFRTYISDRRQLCFNILKRAKERNELEEKVDPNLIADLIYGAYWNRFLIGHAPLNKNYAQEVVKTILKGCLK